MLLNIFRASDYEEEKKKNKNKKRQRPKPNWGIAKSAIMKSIA